MDAPNKQVSKTCARVHMVTFSVTVTEEVSSSNALRTVRGKLCDRSVMRLIISRERYKRANVEGMTVLRC